MPVVAGWRKRQHFLFDYEELLPGGKATLGDLQHLLWRSGLLADAEALADEISALKLQLFKSVLAFLEKVQSSS